MNLQPYKLDVNSTINRGLRNGSDQQSPPRVQSYPTITSHQQPSEPADSSKLTHDSSAWKTANSLLMLCHRINDQSKQELQQHTKPQDNNNDAPRTPEYKTIGGAIDSIAGASVLGNPVHPTPMDNKANRGDHHGEDVQTAYANQYLAYTKQLANALIRPPMLMPSEIKKERDGTNAIDKDHNALSHTPATSLPSPYSALMNNMQASIILSLLFVTLCAKFCIL